MGLLRRICLGSVMALILCVTVHAAPKPYEVGKAPAWVELIQPDDAAVVPQNQISGGVHYVLLDSQTRIEGPTRVRYHHMAIKAVNEDGVNSAANVEVEFDPSYQSLTFHVINVRRGGRVIDKLPKVDIRVLQRERDWESQILDGTLSATAVLEDVQVGDTVEYAYTLRGTNPVFQGMQFGELDQQWGRPLHRLVQRLLWPADRAIYFAHRNTTLDAKVLLRGQEVEYRWDTSDVPALRVQDNTPNWFDPYPTIQWGQFGDWGAVARWATPLFKVPTRLDASLQAQVDRIAKAHASPQERAMAALNLVQSEVRYLGIEMGAGSHVPTAPGVVWQRRFGDCKDKSLLTVTLLRALGIEAHPALVNTRRDPGLPDRQASPAAFNHAIVRARIDGQDHWLDPTMAPQRSTLDKLVQSNLKHALVLDSETKALSPMAVSDANRYKRTIRAELDASAGIDQPVAYTVRTTYEGASAQSIRGVLASNNRDELQKDYRNFYARYHDGIQSLGPIEVNDDERANQLTITERYRVPGLWGKPLKDLSRVADVAVPDLDDLLKSPADHERNVPLGLVHPMEVLHITQVRLPWRPEIEAEQSRVSDPAFQFDREVAIEGSTLTLTDHWVSKSDHVPAKALATYAANLKRVRQAVDYSITMKPGTALTATPKTSGLPSQLNWPVALSAVLLLGIYGALAWRLHGYDEPPRSPAVSDRPALRIGGWLVVVAVGLVLSCLRLLAALFARAPSYALDNWATLTQVGDAAFDPMKVPLLLFQMAALLAALVFMGLVAVLFFQRRSSLPRVSTGVLVGLLALSAIDLSWSAAWPPTQTEGEPWPWFGLCVAALAAWWPVCRYSRRIRDTFVVRRALVDESATLADAGTCRACGLAREGQALHCAPENP